MINVILLEVGIYRDIIHAHKLLIVFINTLSECLIMLLVYTKAPLFIILPTTRKNKLMCQGSVYKVEPTVVELGQIWFHVKKYQVSGREKWKAFGSYEAKYL